MYRAEKQAKAISQRDRRTFEASCREFNLRNVGWGVRDSGGVVAGWGPDGRGGEEEEGGREQAGGYGAETPARDRQLQGLSRRCTESEREIRERERERESTGNPGSPSTIETRRAY